jgi:hypothetical protein
MDSAKVTCVRLGRALPIRCAVYSANVESIDMPLSKAPGTHLESYEILGPIGTAALGDFVNIRGELIGIAGK